MKYLHLEYFDLLSQRKGENARYFFDLDRVEGSTSSTKFNRFDRTLFERRWSNPTTGAPMSQKGTSRSYVPLCCFLNGWAAAGFLRTERNYCTNG